MAGLSDLTPEERELVVSVPYRVGSWISVCDDNEKTNFDDKRERQALQLAVGRMAKAHRKMPFAAAIMREIEGNRSQWTVWDNNIAENNVLQDTEKAIGICRAKFSKKEVSQYKQAVWNTAIIVAQAFGEQIDPDNEMHVDRFFAWLGSFIMAPSLRKAPENMSPTERTALKKLRAVLKG
jgi:hypothetical protein